MCSFFANDPICLNNPVRLGRYPLHGHAFEEAPDSTISVFVCDADSLTKRRIPAWLFVSAALFSIHVFINLYVYLVGVLYECSFFSAIVW